MLAFTYENIKASVEMILGDAQDDKEVMEKLDDAGFVCRDESGDYGALSLIIPAQDYNVHVHRNKEGRIAIERREKPGLKESPRPKPAFHVSDIVKLKADGTPVVITEVSGTRVLARPLSSGAWTSKEDPKWYSEEDVERTQAEYAIPVTWTMSGTVRVKASSVSEAIQGFERDMDNIPLPDGDYVDDSFEMTESDSENLQLYQ